MTDFCLGYQIRSQSDSSVFLKLKQKQTPVLIMASSFAFAVKAAGRHIRITRTNEFSPISVATDMSQVCRRRTETVSISA